MVKKALIWTLGLFLIFFVVTRPGAAAQVVKLIGSGILGVAQGAGDFFTKIIG